MRDISMLHPRIQDIIPKLKAVCLENGLVIGIGECVRTKEEQDNLYKKGRTLPGNIVTNAKGSTYSSMHQWGVAFDFYRNDKKGAFDDSDGFFKKVGNLGKELGLFWGGDFKSPVDKPHFQLNDWGKTPSVLKQKYKNPQNFFKSWEMNEMTKEEKNEFEKLKKEVEKLKAEKEKIYHYTMSLPEYARPTIQKLLDLGIYKGSAPDDLNMTETLMRILVINDRAGLY